MAASKETTDKPTTKTAKAAAPEVAKVSAGETNKGADATAPDKDDPGADGLIYSQADLDKAVADAVAAQQAQANLDELVNAERQAILRALKGDGALPPDVREALDKELAGARKEGFDAGKEEALEELAEKEAGSTEAGNDDDYDDFQSMVGRGIILGIILKMPENYRIAGEKAKLDEIDDFLQSIEGGAERVVAVEIIKSLAENRPTDLASPNYQAIVKRGLKIVRGEALESDPHADAANSPTAAFERMQRASAEGGSDNYVPPQAMPAEAPVGLEGEELEAFNRMQRALAG